MQASVKSGSIFCATSPFNQYIKNCSKLPFGAIIGEVTLTQILRVEDFALNDVEMNKLTLEEKAFGDYSAGRFGWLFENAVAYEIPIRTRGHLRLWDVKADW